MVSNLDYFRLKILLETILKINEFSDMMGFSSILFHYWEKKLIFDIRIIFNTFQVCLKLVSFMNLHLDELFRSSASALSCMVR